MQGQVDAQGVNISTGWCTIEITKALYLFYYSGIIIIIVFFEYVAVVLVYQLLPNALGEAVTP